MSKVVNIEADEVFKTLATGVSVYSINTDTDELNNLRYEVVEVIINTLKSKRTGFFIVEKEEK